MTVLKVVEDIAFGAHWPCQSIGRGLCAKVRAGGSPRASREPLVASADEPSVGSVAREKNRVPFRTVFIPIGCALSLSSDLASTLYDTIYDDIS